MKGGRNVADGGHHLEVPGGPDRPVRGDVPGRDHLWEQFLSEGKFIGASLTPIEGGMRTPTGQRHYILHVEVPGMAEHEEFDEHPKFLDFLPKAKALQPEEPSVWFGTTLFKVGG
jgi:hypothetical protein